jgi:hypothetical protein
MRQSPPASHEARAASGKIRLLPLDFWPDADRNAWDMACRPATRLKRGGAAAHLQPVTRDDLSRRYGYFLDFLERRGLLDSGGHLAANVTVENVDAYIAELKGRVGSVTSTARSQSYGVRHSSLTQAATSPGSLRSRGTSHS